MCSWIDRYRLSCFSIVSTRARPYILGDSSSRAGLATTSEQSATERKVEEGSEGAHPKAALATGRAILVRKRADDLVRIVGDGERVLALGGAGRHGRSGSLPERAAASRGERKLVCARKGRRSATAGRSGSCMHRRGSFFAALERFGFRCQILPRRASKGRKGMRRR